MTTVVEMVFWLYPVDTTWR